MTSILLFLALTVLGQALTPATYFTQADRERLRGVFTVPYGDDVELIHYSILGFTLLEEVLAEPQVCTSLCTKWWRYFNAIEVIIKYINGYIKRANCLDI